MSIPCAQSAPEHVAEVSGPALDTRQRPCWAGLQHGMGVCAARTDAANRVPAISKGGLARLVALAKPDSGAARKESPHGCFEVELFRVMTASHIARYGTLDTSNAR